MYSADITSSYSLNPSGTNEQGVLGSLRSINNTPLEATDENAVSDHEASANQSKPNSSLSNNTKLSLTRLDIPEVINKRKDFDSPQAKGDPNIDLNNANKLQVSAQHRPN